MDCTGKWVVSTEMGPVLWTRRRTTAVLVACRLLDQRDAHRARSIRVLPGKVTVRRLRKVVANG